MQEEKKKRLERIATQIRLGVLEAVYHGKSGHPGGSLSVCDILSVLYFHEMNVDQTNPNLEERDRLILSKGHCSPALYSALSLKGFLKTEELATFRTIDSRLQGHPDKNKVPGVDMTTGSLGQGLSAANGMALAGKLQKKDYRVYAILGDGEIEEGQIWEAAMTSSKYQLDNLCAILDYNHLQIDGTIEEVKGLGQIEEKWKSFGWETYVMDGHSISEIIKGLEKAKNTKGKPTILIANTIKGKGISFMENQVGWHGKAPNDEQYKIAIQELRKQLEKEE